MSSRTGFRKPDHKAFLNAVETLDVSPRHCVFIDDRTTHVAAASVAGMDAILMKGEGDLRFKLIEPELLA